MPAITNNGDGFYSVAGVAGYFTLAEAQRVAAQVDIVNDYTVETPVLGEADVDVPVRCVMSSDGTRLYVLGYSSGDVTVIDTSDRSVVATIATGGTELLGLALRPDGTRLYVCVGDSGSNFVAVINTADNTVVTTIAVGDRPSGVMVLSNAKAFVTNRFDGTVSVLNLTNNTVSATTTVGGHPEKGCIISTRLYVPNEDDGTVSVINTTTNAVSTTLSGFTNPYRVVAAPGGSEAYVLDRSGHVRFLDTNAVSPTYHTIVASLAMPGTPEEAVISTDGATLYVSGGGGVVLVQTSTRERIGSAANFASENADVALSSDGAKLWQVDPSGGKVRELDVTKLGQTYAVTLAAADLFCRINTGSLALTVNLPSAAACEDGEVRRYTNAGSATLTMDGNGASIAGSGTRNLAANATLAVYSDGVDWWYA